MDGSSCTAGRHKLMASSKAGLSDAAYFSKSARSAENSSQRKGRHVITSQGKVHTPLRGAHCPYCLIT